MKKYWKDLEERQQEEKVASRPLPANDPNPISGLLEGATGEGSASRRDFLKLCGFSFAVSALASCKSRVRKIVPYVVAPYEITPGEANYYASSYVSGSDYCSVVVKTREGRPIKIEGNPDSTLTQGGTSARVQASLMELYDTHRHQSPLIEGSVSDWESIDMEIPEKLKEISEGGGTIVLLTPTIHSPSTRAAIALFQEFYPQTQWIQYDAISVFAIREANRISFNREVIPDYRFDKADLIVSFGADFLGTWLSPIEYTKQFASRRDPDREMTRLIQVESSMSLTGCNADRRIQIKPSEEGALLGNIYRYLVSEIEGIEVTPVAAPADTDGITRELLAARGKSLVISGSNDISIQQLVNEINRLLDNVGSTVLLDSPLLTYQGRDPEMEELVQRLSSGSVDALLVYDVNPAYSWYDAAAFANGMKNTGLTVALSGAPDETSELAHFVCPDNHYLESWNDAEPKKNKYSLCQPVIEPIFDTRQFQETLLKWTGKEESFYEFLNSFWAEHFLPLQTEHFDPDAFFDHALQRGVFEPVVAAGEENQPESEDGLPADTEGGQARNGFDLSKIAVGAAEEGIQVVLHESMVMGNGRHANNPWLQELPDPVSRICWDNYASVSPRQAEELMLQDGDMVRISGMEIPIQIQPGQAFGTVGIALGYGRRNCGKVGKDVGKDAWPATRYRNGTLQYWNLTDEITPTGSGRQLARTQTHHTMEGRGMVRETSLEAYREDPGAGNEEHAHFLEHAESLYKEREYPSHHWGMAIDLGACTGCANCVIACQAENNVPVVGREEVTRVHEMHWIRIDRYYNGDEQDPGVVFQPVMCQHCDNAPCENVCPVAATNQSSEGLNQMVYNRCIGTRYCNNNCPYKVRRFNWFNYTEAGTLKGNLRDAAGMTLDLKRMVLNPDVTVRSQGVIEKCSLCVQRIQASKLKAKAEDRALHDEELQTACSQSCPANAIVFGDMNDPASEISGLISSGRRYNLLEELYTKPSVHYLTKIRNT